MDYGFYGTIIIKGVGFYIMSPVPGPDQFQLRMEFNDISVFASQQKNRHNRRSGFQRQKGKPLVGAGPVVEEIHEYAFVPVHVLVHQQSDYMPVLQLPKYLSHGMGIGNKSRSKTGSQAKKKGIQRQKIQRPVKNIGR
jgi:hypothetical protein